MNDKMTITYQDDIFECCFMCPGFCKNNNKYLFECGKYTYHWCIYNQFAYKSYIDDASGDRFFEQIHFETDVDKIKYENEKNRIQQSNQEENDQEPFSEYIKK